MVKKDVHRFEIWLVQLDPAQGSEIKKTRPCVVVSPDEMAALRTVIVAPMTSKGFHYPTRIQYTFQGKKGLILLDQLRTVDKSRLLQRVGLISQNSQIKIINCLQELFAY
ncbi:Toxin-antitoxin system, toxin component, mRNA interferase PemK/MazF-like [Desulfonema limicola]|uniref:Toxin-antitoxin system, toxin component, mRNA interferase PemK/MazF-like n=1 Tax=Desulfonema limicola TaxID=45656 RepID=A0A975GFY6_9BACT|nr:type II toxin-antitoxin system PemK/MazF family toxin [Desulfonema limicola]QTA79679.1 Toxin-antitoxin system, toxin component, mRNA interferase PemK/MazF-like [Desulfonema limicola]